MGSASVVASVAGHLLLKAGLLAGGMALRAHLGSLLAMHRLAADSAGPLGGHQRDHVAAAHDAYQLPRVGYGDAADAPLDQQMPYISDRGLAADRDQRDDDVTGERPGLG